MSKEIDAFALAGGVDSSTPYLSRKAGSLITAKNFAPDPDGGYTLMQGYERFDGRRSPTRTQLMAVAVQSVPPAAGSSLSTVPPSVGTILTGSVSGAKAEFIGQHADGDDLIYFYVVSGALQVGDELTGYPARVAVKDVPAKDSELSPPDAPLKALRKAGREYLRGLIGIVPGSGPVRAVWERGGEVFAWRDNAQGTAAVIHRATATGWQAVSTAGMAYLKFKEGTKADPFLLGDIIRGVTSGAQGVVVQIAAAGADRKSGTLALKTVAGAFAADEMLRLSTSVVDLAKVVSASSDLTIKPGGTYQVVSYNFYGDSIPETMYFANGVGPAWAFTGDSLMPIRTGLSDADEKPAFAVIHDDHLWLGYDYGMVQASVIGEPLSFDGALGAASFALGSKTSNLLTGPGALLATTQHNIQVIYGKDPKDFRKETITKQLSALPFTAGYLGVGLVMTTAGITALNRIDAYGNFQDAVVSDNVRKEMRKLAADGVTTAMVHRDEGYYMLFGAKGLNYLMAQSGNQSTGIMPFDWDRVVRYASMNEKHLYFTDDSGYVFEGLIGATHDGQPREWYLQTSYAHQGMPMRRKRYRRVILSCSSFEPFRFNISTVYSKGSVDVAGSDNQVNTLGGGGRWDLSTWNNIVWDGQDVPELFTDTDGVGTDISILIYEVSEDIDTFAIEDATIQYSLRGLQR